MSEPTQAHIDTAHAIFKLWMTDNSGSSLEQRDRMIRMIAGALADAAERSLAPATPTEPELGVYLRKRAKEIAYQASTHEEGWLEHHILDLLERAAAPPATQTGDVRKAGHNYESGFHTGGEVVHSPDCMFCELVIETATKVILHHASNNLSMEQTRTIAHDIADSLLLAASAAPTPEPTGADEIDRAVCKARISLLRWFKDFELDTNIEVCVDYELKIATEKLSALAAQPGQKGERK